MSIIIPESHQHLLTAPLNVTFVTVSAIGRPHATMVWRMWEAPYIVVSIVKNSVKHRNIENNPYVAVLAYDPARAPYQYLELRGVVQSITPDPDAADLDRISLFYEGKPYYGGVEPLSEKGTLDHLTLKILPGQVNAH